MCPTYTFIDRANGRFNGAMSFKREYAALLSAMWDIDTAYDKYLTDPDANAEDFYQRFGLVTKDEDGFDARDEILKKLLDVKKSNRFRQKYIGDVETLDDLTWA